MSDPDPITKVNPVNKGTEKVSLLCISKVISLKTQVLIKQQYWCVIQYVFVSMWFLLVFKHCST